MERTQEATDFSYRNLSDADERSGAHLQEPSTTSVVARDVELHLTGSGHGGASIGTPQSSVLQPEEQSRASFRTLGNNEPQDWNSEEGIRQSARPLSRHNTFQDIARRMSAINRQRIEIPALVTNTSASLHSPAVPPSMLTPQSKPASPVKKLTKPRTQSGPKETLHGKDIGHFVSIGSVDQIARHSNSVDWSEAMAIPDEPDHLTLMDPYYDLTKAKLSRVFSLFHPDAQGMVSYEGFRRGLEAMGIYCADDDEFQSFIAKVDEDHSGGISFDEFQHAIQEIKLAQLFKDDFIREMALDFGHLKQQEPVLGSIEYSPDRIRSVYPINNVEKFIYSKKPSWAAVRWINVEGYNPLLIRRLSVRYRLHPLAVEDTLDIDRERPKYETYDEHSSLILQTVRPVDMAKLRVYQRMYRNSLYDKDEGPSQFELMDKKELDERLDELRMGKLMTKPEQISVYMMKDVLISVQEGASPLWGVIKSRLETSYSKLRQNSVHFLAYTIIDVCVDDLAPIVHTLGAKLMMLERLAQLDSTKFNDARVHNCAKQLKGLKRLCKPLNEVVVQMSESHDFTGEILRYFRDVQDHIAIIQEDCDKHLDACKSLVEQLSNLREKKQNDTGFVLTIVAAIFLPAQFLTGLEGMNFRVMPELQLTYGYLYWWLIVLALLVGTAMYFHKKRWI